MAILTDEARKENSLALATAAGLAVSEAAERLEITVLVSHDASVRWAAQLAAETAQLLERTVHDVVTELSDGVTVELVIGGAQQQSAGMVVLLSLDADTVRIAKSRGSSDTGANIPALFLSLVACYASAAVLHRAFGDILPYAFPDPFVLRFDDLGISRAALTQPVEIGRAYMAGAGAIGNAVLWAARHTDMRGELVIADDDSVDSGNLNRQIWFGTADLGMPKAERLAHHAQPCWPRLKLIPEKHRIQDLPQRTDGPWLKRLIIAVDSRRARRELQTEFPGEVFDASTTDIREVVSFYNRQPSPLACLSCVYEPDAEEQSREQHIAEHLGVDVSEVRTERISSEAAALIAARFPKLEPTHLVGTSYDTLFKKLCAEGELQTLEGRRIVAPFAFVSCLAGVILLLDMIRRLVPGDGTSSAAFNYWRVSAWHPPLERRRETRVKQPNCPFCGRRALVSVNERLWSPR